MKKIATTVLLGVFAVTLSWGFDSGLKKDVSEVVVPKVSLGYASEVVKKLNNVGLQKLRKEILNIKGLPVDFLSALNSDGVVVLYNHNTVLLISPLGVDKYAIHWENNQELVDLLNRKVKESQEELKQFVNPVPGADDNALLPIIDAIIDSGGSSSSGSGGSDSDMAGCSTPTSALTDPDMVVCYP